MNNRIEQAQPSANAIATRYNLYSCQVKIINCAGEYWIENSLVTAWHTEWSMFSIMPKYKINAYLLLNILFVHFVGCSRFWFDFFVKWTYWRGWSHILPYIKSHFEHLHRGLPIELNIYSMEIFRNEIQNGNGKVRARRSDVATFLFQKGQVARNWNNSARIKTECNLFLYRTETNFLFLWPVQEVRMWHASSSKCRLQEKSGKKITSSSLGIIADAVVLMKCRHTTNHVTIIHTL